MTGTEHDLTEDPADQRPRPTIDPDALRRTFDDVAREPGSDKPDTVLRVEGLRRRFGGIDAVDVEHLAIERHSITALIGPNGAGKTTLFNLISGFDRPQEGSAWFDGQILERDIRLWPGRSYRRRTPPHSVARMGLVRTFQLTKVMSRMSVIDNMRLGATDQRGESMGPALVRSTWRRQETAVTERAEALLEQYGIAHMRDEYAGTLSGGQRKLLEMARALMTDPRALLLDEPMAGVNPALKQSLLDHIRELRTGGRTIVFVEHDMDAVMGISDWVVCMGEGKVIAEGPPDAVGRDEVVIDAYLGTRHARPDTDDVDVDDGTEPT